MNYADSDVHIPAQDRPHLRTAVHWRPHNSEMPVRRPFVSELVTERKPLSPGTPPVCSQNGPGTGTNMSMMMQGQEPLPCARSQLMPHPPNARLRYQMLRKNFAVMRKHFESAGEYSTVDVPKRKPAAKVESNGTLKGRVTYNNSFNINETQVNQTATAKAKRGGTRELSVKGNRDSMIYHWSSLYKGQELRAMRALAAHDFPEPNAEVLERTEQAVQAGPDPPCTGLKDQKAIDGKEEGHEVCEVGLQTDTIQTKKEEGKKVAKNCWEKYVGIADEYVARIFGPVSPKIQYDSCRASTEQTESKDSNSSISRMFAALGRTRPRLMRRPRTVKYCSVRRSRKPGTSHQSPAGEAQSLDERALRLSLEQRIVSEKMANFEQMLRQKSVAQEEVCMQPQPTEIVVRPAAVAGNVPSEPESPPQTEQKEQPLQEDKQASSRSRRTINISLLDPAKANREEPAKADNEGPVELKKEDSLCSNAELGVELECVWSGKQRYSPTTKQPSAVRDRLVRVDTPEILKVAHRRCQSGQVPRKPGTASGSANKSIGRRGLIARRKAKRVS